MWFSVLIMILLFILGFWEIVKGIWVFFSDLQHPTKELSSDSWALELCIKGFEFIFLAPLAYFLILGVARYAYVITPNPNVDDSGTQKTNKEEIEFIERVRSDLMIVKAFTVSLFIAVFFASLLERAFSAKGLEYESSICTAGIIIVLIIYYYILEKNAYALRKSK
jgi:hypothetical protein